MKMIVTIAALSFMSSPVFSQSRVTWDEHEKFAELLLASTDLPGVSTFGVEPGRAWESSSCSASVLRPDRMAGPTTDDQNVVWCELSYNEHEKGLIVWKPADVGFEAWGNRFDKFPFQIIDQPAATALYQQLKQQVKADPGNPWYSEIFVCGPDGSCTESYFINREPTDDSPGAFGCNLDYLGSRILKTRCVFLKFQ